MKIASDWTVDESSTRYDLPGGQWIEFRDEVAYGQQADLDIACKGLADERALAKRLAFHVTAWSLTYPANKGGGPLPICEDALEAMPIAKVMVLVKALHAHTQAVEARYADPLSEPASSSALP